VTLFSGRGTLFSVVVCSMFFAISFPANSQQPGKIFHIGFLDPSTASGSAISTGALGRELGKLGWIDGKNIVFEYRFAQQQRERLPQRAAELVGLKVDLIVTIGRMPGFAAKKATSTILVVMMQFPDPVGEGLVASLARPGGNITGLSTLGYELNTKRLELLKDAVSKLARVSILQQVGFEEADVSSKQIEAAALALKLKLERIATASDGKGLESAFQIAKQKQVGAVMIGGGRVLLGERKRVVELAGKYRLPAIYPQKEYVDEGGLMSYGVDFDDLYRHAAGYVDKILKGARPGDLPVQQATKFEFVVSLKAAKQIDLTIPNRVLERANQVIK